MRRITRKWRPPLALVIGGTLAAVLTLPIFGIVYLRLFGNVMGWGEAALLVAAIAVVATVVLAFLLWRLVLRPVYRLTRYAEGVKRGEDVPAPTHLGTPEFSALATSVMTMGETLSRRADGMQAYANHVTHELKSPLTAMRGAAEILQSDVPDGQSAALARTVDEAAVRMQALLDALAQHARAAQSTGPGHVLLSDAVQSDYALPVQLAGDGRIPLSPDDVQTILTQLAHNAAEHGATALTVALTADAVRIGDDGPGISAGNRARVFDPFFTTRREQGGTGMGLAIVRSLVQARGGQIALLQDGPGAQFLITFD